MCKILVLADDLWNVRDVVARKFPEYYDDLAKEVMTTLKYKLTTASANERMIKCLMELDDSKMPEKQKIAIKRMAMSL